MAKKQSYSHQIDCSKESYICVKKGIKVYPVFINKSWFIEVDDNGKKTRYEKAILQDEINNSIAQTYIFYSKKIKELENGKL